MQKTNAMRLLDKNKVEYQVHEYEAKDGHIDGISVAEKLGQNKHQVFKTLVTQGVSKELYVFVIPVDSELNLKRAAKITNEKKVDMIQVKDIMKYTGYIRGGCSPLGMKKQYKTYFNDCAKEFNTIIFSGGKIGLQIEANPYDVINLIKAQFCNCIY